jgi:Zn finger protein HypA/HybF involved in hydrogenase expression
LEEVEPVVWCEACGGERTLSPGGNGSYRMRCPACDAPAARLVRGREMELVSIEVLDGDVGRAADPSGPHANPQAQ